MRASDSRAEFPHSLVLQVVPRQVQLAEDALLGGQARGQLCTAVIRQAAVTQAGTQNKSQHEVLVLCRPTYQKQSHVTADHFEMNMDLCQKLMFGQFYFK